MFLCCSSYEKYRLETGEIYPEKLTDETEVINYIIKTLTWTTAEATIQEGVVLDGSTGPEWTTRTWTWTRTWTGRHGLVVRLDQHGDTCKGWPSKDILAQKYLLYREDHRVNIIILLEIKHININSTKIVLYKIVLYKHTMSILLKNILKTHFFSSQPPDLKYLRCLNFGHRSLPHGLDKVQSFSLWSPIIFSIWTIYI